MTEPREQPTTTPTSIPPTAPATPAGRGTIRVRSSGVSRVQERRAAEATAGSAPKGLSQAELREQARRELFLGTRTTRRRTAPAAPRRIAAALSGLGVLVSGYLTAMHFAGISVLCTGVGGCDTVNSSPYAYLFGVPIALLGLLLYLGCLGLSLAWLRSAADSVLGYGVFGLALAGVAYSAYLTWLELFVIQAICPWCVTSAVLLVGILAASGIALVCAGGQAAAP